MKKLFFALAMVILMAAFIIYFLPHKSKSAEQKLEILKLRYDRKLNNLNMSSHGTCQQMLSGLGRNISILEEMKSDSLTAGMKDGYYNLIKLNGLNSTTALDLFSLLYMIHLSDSTSHTLSGLLIEFEKQSGNANSFFIRTGKGSELKRGEIDLLISYEKNLIDIIGKLDKTKIVW